MESKPGLDLPEHCLRGLRSPKWVQDDGQVITEAFVPDPRTAEGREDRAQETSINWEDNPGVVDFTLSKREQAVAGLARLPRENISIPGTLSANMT